MLQCLHLDKCLLKLQITKKLYGTKNNCVHAQFRQIMDKRQKKKNKKKKQKNKRTQLLLLKSWEQKPGVGSKRHFPWGVSKGTCYLFLLPSAAAGAPIKHCLNFLTSLLSISIDWGKPRTLGGSNVMHTFGKRQH